MTGYADWNGSTYVFTNVGIAGRTGHDYPNRWDDKYLVWYGKTHARRGQPQIDRMISNSHPVHVFWRGEDRSPFTYAGNATAIEATEETPVRVIWSFDDTIDTLGNTRPSTGAKWHRGPPPTHGSVQIEKLDGVTEVYLLRLTGQADAIVDVPPQHVLIKIGMSNNVERRLRELNAGFPPRSKTAWQVVATRSFNNATLAWQYEGRKLERLRLARYWKGGEFAVVPEAMLSNFLSDRLDASSADLVMTASV